MALTKSDLKAIDSLLKLRLGEQELKIDKKLSKLRKSINIDVATVLQDLITHLDGRLEKLEKIHPQGKHSLVLSD